MNLANPLLHSGIDGIIVKNAKEAAKVRLSVIGEEEAQCDKQADRFVSLINLLIILQILPNQHTCCWKHAIVLRKAVDACSFTASSPSKDLGCVKSNLDEVILSQICHCFVLCYVCDNNETNRTPSD